MDEQELFALVRKNYGEANTEYLKQQVIAAVSQMTLPSKKETIDGLLDWIVLAGGCGMNEKYRQFVYSALSLLKEQEARVLDWNEIGTVDGAVWLEDRDEIEVVPGLVMQMHSAVNLDIKKDGKLHTASASRSDYGERWRAWSARPTEKQRKTVKWND